MSGRAAIFVSYAIAAPLAAAQPTAVISSDLAVTAFGLDPTRPPVTDTFAATADNLLQAGFSYSRAVSELNPVNGESRSSVDITISRAHNFRPSSPQGSQRLFDVDITGRIERSTPLVNIRAKPDAFGSLTLELPISFDPVASPIFMVGTASYFSDQAGVGTTFGQPGVTALRVFDPTRPQDPFAELVTDDPSFGTIDISAIGGGFTIEAFSDISEQLTSDDGTSTVEFEITVTYVGIPAPSAALAFGAASLFAARRRRG